MPKNTTKEDIELLNAVRQGNAGAVDELIEKYRSRVEAIASKYKHPVLDRDDTTQEGMIGLLAAIHSYNPEKKANFSTYANVCINNSIISAINKFNRKKDIPIESIVYLEDQRDDKQTMLSAEDAFLAKESVDTLSDTLNEELSSFENQVLRLFMIGCSYSEIAEKLGKNPKAIDNAIQRIRKKLNAIRF